MVKDMKSKWNIMIKNRWLMVMAIAFVVCHLSCSVAQAQPASRRAQQEQAKKSNTDNMTTRAQISFPTQSAMNEDVAWRRDIYREISLMEDENAGLYYPKTPVGNQTNLFTYIFKLVMRGKVKAYLYRTDGNEVFDEDSRVKPLQFLEDQSIYFEKTDRGTRIDDSDIPSEEVKAYFVKESSYYDQATATFHTKVQALCPIRIVADDFGDGGEKRPLFWIVYDELAPFLSKQTMMTSNLNNAATMSVDDYFTKNLYKGKIYKTNNMQGLTIGTGEENDTTAVKEQNKIEQQMKTFESNMWGDQARKDSLDSIAKLDKKELKAMKKKNKTRRGKSSTVKASKSNKRSNSKSSGSNASLSVRRERH